LIVALLMEEDHFGAAKSIRQDGTFCAKVVRDAEALKKALPSSRASNSPTINCSSRLQHLHRNSKISSSIVATSIFDSQTSKRFD